MPRNPEAGHVGQRMRAWNLFGLALALALIAGLGGLLTHHSYVREDASQRAALLTQTRMLAQVLNAGRIASLHMDIRDLDLPDYLRLKEQLSLARSTNPTCRFLYLLGKRGTDVVILVDSEPPESKDYSPPGQVFTEVPDSIRAVFDTKKEIVVGPVRDRWGLWISAVVPIVVPESGEVLALFGMDMNAKEWQTHISAHAAPSALASLLLASIIISFFIHSRRSAQAIESLAASRAALAASEEKTLSVLRVAPVGIGVYTRGGIIDANDALCAMTGYTRDEFVNQSARFLYVSDEEYKRVEREGARQMDEHGTSTVEAHWKRKNGTTMEVVLNATPLDRHDWYKGVTFTAIDITERKRVQRGLQERVVALTQPGDDTTSLQLSDLFNLQDLQRISDAFGAATGVASLITEPDGTPLTQPSNFCHLCKNIIRTTEKGLANCKLSDALIGRVNPTGPTVQRCLSVGLSNAGASISVGGKHLANWLIGQTRDESVDEQKLLLYADEIGADREEFREALAEVPTMSSERFQKVADVLFLFAHELSLKAYQNVQQARFITERERAAVEKEKLEAQLRQAQKMEAVGQLAGGIAHDFNNLLQVILGHLEFARSAAGAEGRSTEGLVEASEAAARAADLTKQLLAFSRRQLIQPVDLDLNELIRGLLNMVRRCIGEHIELCFTPCKLLKAVHVDRGQIEQVLMNLCVNARDAMPHGGKLTITTENVVLDAEFCREHLWAQEGNYVQLTVADTGYGMDEETRAQIFEPFFTTKEVGKGTGLGLATIYGIVKQHEGLIQVSSLPGEGAAFSVYIPSIERETESLDAPASTEVSAGGHETILVAEDEEAVRTLVARMLESAGYSVLVASDGEEAIRVFDEHNGSIDLALLDVIMPRMSGRDVMERIRSQRPTMHFLFSSGYSENAIATDFVVEKGLHVIMKPYRKADLLRAVREVLDAFSETGT
ncbi:MAG: PocR ligand-binding domain-containing protein [Candidatus Hydrogenedentes bacterium]|nr:PocR ligand-binding domain-containing protein [Candidatus Hydrogenedentota bacterium]